MKHKLLNSTGIASALAHLVKGPGHDPRAMDLKPTADKRLMGAAMGQFTTAPGYVPLDQRKKAVSP